MIICARHRRSTFLDGADCLQIADLLPASLSLSPEFSFNAFNAGVAIASAAANSSEPAIQGRRRNTRTSRHRVELVQRASMPTRAASVSTVSP